MKKKNLKINCLFHDLIGAVLFLFGLFTETSGKLSCDYRVTTPDQTLTFFTRAHIN